MKRCAFRIACLAAWCAAMAPALSAPAPPTSKAIDARMDSCLQDHLSTAEMVDCTAAAAKAYDTTLNDYYQALLSGLDAKSAQKLRDAQRKWIQFREADGEI